MRRLALPLAVLALAAAGCVGHGAVSTTPGGLGYNAVAGKGGSLSAGEVAPAVSGTTLTGTHLSTTSLRGHVLVINFWASWCPPCRAEAGTLVHAERAFASRGVRFVGVLTEDSPTNARSFVQAAGIGYPSIVDQSGTDLLEFRNLGFVTIPDTVVVDTAGRVVARFIGAVGSSALDRVLAAATGRT